MIDRILAQLREAHDSASTTVHESTCERYENCSCDVAKDIRGFEKALKDVVFVVDEQTMAAFERLVTGLTITHKLAAETDSGYAGTRHAPAVENCPCQLAQDIRAFHDHFTCLELNRSQVAYLQGDRPDRPADEPATGLEDTARQPDDEQTGRDEAKRRMYDAVAADLPVSSPEDVRGRALVDLLRSAEQATVAEMVAGLKIKREEVEGGDVQIEGLSSSEHTFVHDEEHGTRPGRVTKDGHVVPIELECLPTPAEDRAKEGRRRERTAALEQSFADRSDGIVALDKPTTREERLGEQLRAAEDVPPTGGPRPYVQPEELTRSPRARAPADLDDLTERGPEDSAGMVSASNDAFDKPSDQAAREEKEGIWTKMSPAEAERVRSKARFGRPVPDLGKDTVSVTEMDEKLATGDDSGPNDFDDQKLWAEGAASAIERRIHVALEGFAKRFNEALREFVAGPKDKPADMIDQDARELSFGNLLTCADRIGKQGSCWCETELCSHCKLRKAVKACAQASKGEG